MQIVMDGITYHLRVKFDTITREFHIDDGQNADYMLSGFYQRDLIGTYYDYTLEVEPDPQNPADYDAFYEAISAPINYHSITMPYSQNTITFNAMVTSGRDTYRGKIAGRNRWSGMQVSFTAIEPYREPTA